MEGGLTITWSIANGKVEGAVVTVDTTADIGLQACAEKAAEAARFSQDTNGRVSFNWSLQRQAAEAAH